MKKSFLLLVALSSLSIPAYADQYVNGYYRANGTYVQPHYRSDPDGDSSNNWSTRGNINPYTGQEGTKNVNPPDVGGSYIPNQPIHMMPGIGLPPPPVFQPGQ